MNVAVLIPSRGLVAFDWAIGLANSVAEWGERDQDPYVSGGLNVSLLKRKLLPVDAARNELVHEALNLDYWDSSKKSDYVFFLGDDIIIQSRALSTLLHDAETLDAQVMSGLYFLKSGRPAAFNRVKDDASPTGLRLEPIDTEDNELVQCDTTGLDFCLIRRDVFDKIPKPWFKWTYLDDGSHISEDVHFFDACNKAGIRPWVNTTLRAKHLNLYDAMDEVGEKRFNW